MNSLVKCSIITNRGIFKGTSTIAAISKAYEKIFGVPVDLTDPVLTRAYWNWFWSDEDHIKAVNLEW